MLALVSLDCETQANQVANRNLVSINFYILAIAYCLVAYIVTHFIFACAFLVKLRESRKAKYFVVIWKIVSSSVLLLDESLLLVIEILVWMKYEYVGPMNLMQDNRNENWCLYTRGGRRVVSNGLTLRDAKSNPQPVSSRVQHVSKWPLESVRDMLPRTIRLIQWEGVPLNTYLPCLLALISNDIDAL